MAASTHITTRASYRKKGSELTALYFWGYLAGDRWCSAGKKNGSRDGEKAIATRKNALHIPLCFREAIASERRAVGATLTGQHALFFLNFLKFLEFQQVGKNDRGKFGQKTQILQSFFNRLPPENGDL